VKGKCKAARPDPTKDLKIPRIQIRLIHAIINNKQKTLLSGMKDRYEGEREGLKKDQDPGYPATVSIPNHPYVGTAV
jgi:hypothetical protein